MFATKALRGIRVGVATDCFCQLWIVAELRGLVEMLDVFPPAAFENERPAEVVREEAVRSLRLEEADCPEGGALRTNRTFAIRMNFAAQCSALPDSVWNTRFTQFG